MGDFNVNATILFAIMGFQGLLVVTMLVAVLRLSSVVGRLEGRIDGIWEELRNIRQEVAGLREQVAGLREQVAGLREQVGEVRGLLRALHERVDLVLRHRHDDQSGAVMLTPAEPVPDPSAD